MFELQETTRVVDLQQKSYKLLRWAGDSLQSGTLNFKTVHTALGLSEAAKEWVGRNLASIPREARPDPDDLDTFAHLFASYLETSFDLIPQPGQRLTSACNGCACRFCSYLVAADHLRVKNPDKKAQQKARQMKELYLSSLAVERELSVSYSDVEKLLADPALTEDISYATYGRELLRRSQFASQGEGILVLWREIAWDARGKIKKGFALSAERILKAEASLGQRLERIATEGVQNQ